MFGHKKAPPAAPSIHPPAYPLPAFAAEPVQKKPPKPVNIVPMPVLREGIEFHFMGCERDDEGEPIGEFVDVMLVVAPLNFNSLKGLRNKITSFSDAAEDNAKSMETLCECLQHALRRNYKGVPRWLIEQSVDVGNFAEFMLALMDVSGLKRKAIEDEKKAKAEQATSSSGTTPSAI